MQETRKISMSGRVGYFFLAISAVLACIGLQLVCGLLVLIPAIIIELLQYPAEVLYYDAEKTFEIYMEITAKWTPLATLAYHVVGTVVFGIWYKFCFWKPRPTIRQSFKNFSFKSILVAIGCGIALCLFANGTVVVEMFAMPKQVEAYMELAELAGLGTNMWTIIASIILAPIGEEFICRGVVLQFGQKSFGRFWIANIFQALLFGVIHMNWVQGIYAFVIGLVLGYLVKQYNTILPAMLLHMVVNFSSSTWIAYLLEPVPATLPIGIILCVVPWLVIIPLLLWGRKKKEAIDIFVE